MRIYLTALFVGICLIVNSQVDSINQRIILIGDAGSTFGGTNQVVEWIKKNINLTEKDAVVFLGDNIYPLGLPVPGEGTYETAKAILDYQIGIIKGKPAKGYFLMGNHDWKNGKQGGWEQAMNQVNYINALEQPNIQAWPLNGCAGPVEIELSDKVVLVILDSQWWLHLHEKPGPESVCDFKTQDEIITALREIAAIHPDQLMVVAMHHPMYSYGVHGGNYTLRHHLFPFTEIAPWLYIPLPIIGSIYPVARGVFGNIQDVKHPLYRTMINQIEDVLKEHPNAIHVSGHDHSLQMLMKDSIPYIISGSALDVSRVKTGKNTVFADANLGFAILEVRKSGKVESKFYNLNSANLDNPSYSHELKPVVASVKAAPLDTVINLPDSIAVAGNPELEAGSFMRFLMGDNYRKEWTTPVKVEVLDISKERGGLKPTKRGGGKQTKNLRVEDKDGNEYALRSIQKFPEEAIPADLRQTVAKDIVADGISASYPYGALSYAPLAKALSIPILDRKLVYVPDDPRLGRFRIDFANTLCVLEEREPAGVKKTYNSEELVLRLLKDHDDHIDQKLVLTARLLDNYIMDFDRHEDQWRWATYDTGKGKMYYPIPKDHDQMFFINQGVIPGWLKKPWLIPQIQGFRPNAHNIKTFNFAARNFDRAFMNELTEDDWKKSIDTFLMKMTDSVIVAAVRRQPNEIENFNGDKIIGTLKERRNYFMNDMMEYYRFISRKVDIVGTNQDERITVTRYDNGSVLVQVNTIKGDSTTSLIYERLFDPKVTKELRIYGMGENDKFVFRGPKNKDIKIRIIGGTGDDEFYNESENHGRTRVYDVNFEENKFFGSPIKTKINADPTNNKYERLHYRYNKFQPGIGVAFNRDDGVLLAGRIKYTKYGFRKEPYSMYHDLTVTHALSTKAYNIKYTGEFIDAIGRADLVLRSDIKGPNNTSNFFGLGNETVFDKSKPGGLTYYRSRYNMRDAALMLRHRLQSWMDILYGATFQHYSIDSSENADRILGKPSEIGLDSTRTFITKSYAGLIGAMTIDTRNNDVIPTRGLHLTTYARSLFGTKNGAHNITQLNWDMRLFISIVEETKIVFATRFGVGHNIGDYEFYQAQYLSGLDNLRGYRKDRFAGKTMMFFNNELRFKITDFTTYLIGGSLGLLGFYDIGRVWVKDDNSNKWHSGYGGGLWVSPLKRFVVTVTVGASNEEVLPYVTFGFQF